METEEFRKRVYPDIRRGVNDLVMSELEARDQRIEQLERKLARAVEGSDLIDLVHEYACSLAHEGLSIFREESTPERAERWLDEQGYVTGLKVKPSREETQIERWKTNGRLQESRA
jgi:hypothetical protein